MGKKNFLQIKLKNIPQVKYIKLAYVFRAYLTILSVLHRLSAILIMYI